MLLNELKPGDKFILLADSNNIEYMKLGIKRLSKTSTVPVMKIKDYTLYFFPISSIVSRVNYEPK